MVCTISKTNFYIGQFKNYLQKSLRLKQVLPALNVGDPNVKLQTKLERLASFDVKTVTF